MTGPLRRNRPSRIVLRVGLSAMLATGACSSGGRPTTAEERRQEKIPQPVVPGDFPVAPESQRVDIAMPTFSDPTNVTNPLFPVSQQESVLLLGQVDDQAFRTEVTLLPETKIIDWEGERVEVLVSQYVAYLNGRLHEVAYDFYAQDDGGNVWYFGEDVFNFADGAIVNTHGTWIAGKDGPAAMIMPADPKVEDVYRPENIPGFVFEEVTVKGVDQRLDGPLGPIDGGLVIEELHMDGATEDKTFAPGYGEFFTGGGGDVEAMALAVPTDALSTPVPAELATLATGSIDVFEATRSGNWSAASVTLQDLTAAWEAVRSGEVPTLIEPLMTAALARLAREIDAHDARKAGQAAIDAAQSALDLQLRHRPATEIDLARFELWLGQLLLDAEAGDTASVNGDFFSLDYIRDRIQHTLEGFLLTRVNTELEALSEAVSAEELGPTAEAAEQLRSTVAGLAS